MSQTINKLMSRDQVKTWILANEGGFGTEYAVNFARQLYDAMGINFELQRENELLREALRTISTDTSRSMTIAKEALRE